MEVLDLKSIARDGIVLTEVFLGLSALSINMSCAFIAQNILYDLWLALH